jgi:YVTN family beta-propeller protein
MARIALIRGESKKRNGNRLNLSIAVILAALCVLGAGHAFAEDGYKLYITHPQYYQNDKSAVSVVNYDSLTLVTQINPLAGTEKAIYNPKTGHLYFFSSLKMSCEVFDPVKDEKLFDFETGGQVADVVFSHDGNTIYIANGGREEGLPNSVSVIEAATGTKLFTIKVGRNPFALELSADGQYLYVADRDMGVVHVVELTNFQVLRSFYGGVKPSDLKLSWDGRSLIITSANLDADGAGAGMVIVNLNTESVAALIQTEGDLEKIILPDGNRIACLEKLPGGDILNIFSHKAEQDESSINVLRKIDLNGAASDLALAEKGRSLVVSYSEKGSVAIVDLEAYQIKGEITDLFFDTMAGLAMVPVDFGAQIAIRDSIIAFDQESEAARDAYFEKAYLYRSMGDKNSEVKIYNELAGRYSGSETEVLSFLRLGDLCYNDKLYSNSADFYNRAFKAYAAFLEKTGGQTIDDNLIFSAIEKLGEFSVANKKDYLNQIVASIEKLTISSYQLAELNLLLAYYLKKQGETRLSRRCLDETERQMIHLTDQGLYKQLRDRIDLLNAEGRVILTAQKIRRGPVIDADPSDWNDKHSLVLDRRTDMLVNSHRWIDENDLAFEMRAAYDGDNLYLFGRVTDNKLFAGDDLKRDKLVLYIDTRENSGSYVDRVSEMNADVFMLEIIPPVESGIDFEFNHAAAIQPVFSGKTSESGYAFEIKIPFVYLKGIGPGAREKCGIGVEIWDADSDLLSDPLKIMGWVAPTESIDGGRDCRMFGILEL